MKTWLDKLCEPLEHPKYPQIKGRLVELDMKGDITGKCAEGEIVCQNNLTNISKHWIDRSNWEKLGVPKDLMNDLPFLFDSIYSQEDNYSISDYIISLNDHGYSYPEIVEFLRATFEDAV